MKNKKGVLTTSENLKVHPRMKELYKFFKYNGKVIDVENYNPEVMGIFSREVLAMIENNTAGWEKMLPLGVGQIIKDKKLFSYCLEK